MNTLLKYSPNASTMLKKEGNLVLLKAAIKAGICVLHFLLCTKPQNCFGFLEHVSSLLTIYCL